MDSTLPPDSPAPPSPLARIRQASQSVHATQALDEVLTRIITELHSTLDAEAATVALLDQDGNIVLYAAGPVSEQVTGLQMPPGRGIVGWVIANAQSLILNDVSDDERFWPEVDGYSGFETRAVLCTPLVSGKVIGALEVLNKRHGDFGSEDLNFLEALGAVAVSAIENARRFRQEQRRRRQADTLRRTWEALTTPRELGSLLDVILDQLSRLIEYCSASILFVTEDGGLELGASRGLGDPVQIGAMIRKLGVDVKVRTMLETRQPLLIADTRADPRWRHFPARSHVRSWMGAPLFIKGHLVGTLNVDHKQAGHYTPDQAQLLTSFAHQAAVAIENSRLYDATRKATLQLNEKARRMVTLYETSRALLSGLELDHRSLRELINRITNLIGARYGLLNVLAQDGRPRLFVSAGLADSEVAGIDLVVLERDVQDVLDNERELVRGDDLGAVVQTWRALPPVMVDGLLGVAIHARGRMLGWLLLAGQADEQPFSQDDEALALALATNLASTIENASLYYKTQQRLLERTILYEISRTAIEATQVGEAYTRLTTQVAQALDAERCVFFIYKDDKLVCQSPGYGMPDELISELNASIKEGDPLHSLLHVPETQLSNAVMDDEALVVHRELMARWNIRRLLSSRIVIDEQQVGLLVAANKRGGEEFNEQDRRLASIMAQQISGALHQALSQSRQREHLQIQSALLKVSQATSSLTNLEQLLQTVAQITRQLVGCHHCIIASWEERYTAFVPRAQSGLDQALNDLLPQQLLRPDELAFIDLMTRKLEPVLLTRQDVFKLSPTWMPDILGLESSLIVPLVIQGRVVGLIVTAYAQESRPPQEKEITLVTAIARQAAVAIENVSLYQDLQLHSKRLERAYSELKELDRQKTQFIQNVSHELRTPFTLIGGYLELLADEEMGNLNTKQKKALEIIIEKTAALDQVINDIVAIQSVDAAALELYDFDFGIVLRAILERFDTPGIRLQDELPLNLPLVRADPNLVGRALQHLLDNAIKFSPNGGTISVSARPEGDKLRVEVQDQGIGIPAEAQPFIFKLFYQADGSTTRKFGGTGLGLAVVEQIIRAHGGQIGVHSVEGEGSLFYFTLPLAA